MSLSKTEKSKAGLKCGGMYFETQCLSPIRVLPGFLFLVFYGIYTADQMLLLAKWSLLSQLEHSIANAVIFISTYSKKSLRQTSL